MTEGASPSRPSPLIWLIPLGVALLCFMGIVLWLFRHPVPDSGIEVGFRIGVSDADRPRIAAELQPAARRRLDSMEIGGAGFTIEKDLLILRLPGATPETVTRVKRLFRTRGDLQLRPVAPLAIQKQYNEDQIVPGGYQVVENTMSARGGEYEAYGAKILVQLQSALEGRHIIQAEPRQEMGVGGNQWVTSFELDVEGAGKFDEMAEKLYNQRPPGLLAIMLDGVLKSAPAVRSAAFRGRGQISGAKSEEEAKDLAIILKTGALPVQLGEPEFERPFGPKK
jgi:preprotein translocase subunit SecD